MKKLLILGVALTLMALLITSSVGAAPRATLYGPQPLYDSGWVLTSNGLQTFTHNLDAFPTNIVIFVADDDRGYFPSMAMDAVNSGGNAYGSNVRDVHYNSLEIYWQADGIAYNHSQGKWYERGEAHARVLVFSADSEFELPPIRP